MRLVIIMAILTTLSIPSGISALSVSPNHFSEELSHGATYSNHFRITPNATPAYVSVGYSSPFVVELGSMNMTLDTYYDMDFNITIPDGFLHGVYQSYIFVNGENDTKFVTVELTVKEDLGFTVSEKVNVTERAGGFGFFFVRCENTGNEKIDITINTSGSVGNLSPTVSQVCLYPDVPFDIPFTYTINDNVLPDTYLSSIWISGGDSSKNVPAYFTVLDGTLPVIEDVGVIDDDDDLEAGLEYEFWAKCSDNIGVRKVDISIDSEAFNDTYGMALKDGRWRLGFTPEFTGDTEFTVHCEDNHGNIANKTFTREIVRIQGCEISGVEFYSIKRDTTISRAILDCEHEIPVTVKLKDFEYEPFGNENSSNFEFFLDDGTEKHNLRENSSIELDEIDYLKVGLNANESGFYSGKLELEFPNWIHDDVTLDFSGKVGDLTVPEEYYGYVGDGNLNCKANLTEDERTSMWDCVVSYPITTPLDLLAKPMTPSRYKEIENTFNERLAIKDERITQQGAEIGMLWGVLIIICAAIITLFIFPNFVPKRFKMTLRFKFR